MESKPFSQSTICGLACTPGCYLMTALQGDLLGFCRQLWKEIQSLQNGLYIKFSLLPRCSPGIQRIESLWQCRRLCWHLFPSWYRFSCIYPENAKHSVTCSQLHHCPAVYLKLGLTSESASSLPSATSRWSGSVVTCIYYRQASSIVGSILVHKTLLHKKCNFIFYSQIWFQIEVPQSDFYLICQF